MNSRTVLITGGSRGLGAAISTALAAQGHLIIAPARSDLDLSELSSVEAWISKNQALPIDILINNAGINILNPIASITIDSWQSMLQTNLTSAMLLIQAFAPAMETQRWGRILNISTIFSMVTKERRAAYSMTKAALNALTRSAAVEYGPSGILVNALAPGYVNTELTRQNNSLEALGTITTTIPLRRMAEPEELALAAAFLVSEQNSYLTGQIITVDGGFTCL